MSKLKSQGHGRLARTLVFSKYHRPPSKAVAKKIILFYNCGIDFYILSVSTYIHVTRLFIKKYLINNIFYEYVYKIFISNVLVEMNLMPSHASGLLI